ncbi:MAG: hypothetical protein PHH68_05650 [Candidatus Omnitrophica bacterium]|jgi:hypothetical protein|nr:hypothetical protein [Candidatus Omnitrophota bacterium]MDD5079793.1 hypothetical protein [Candidatus Omnitrophota bacterium]
MKTLKLKAVHPTARILKSLEARGLIRRLDPPKAILDSRSANGAVRTIYASAPRFGSHKLICIKLNSPVPKLNSHEDNEEFIIVNPGGNRLNPVYILIALDKHEAFERKARGPGLRPEDFVFLRMKYNDFSCCIFTMLKGAVHCEVALKGKAGFGAPVFFVSEPSKLKMKMARLNGHVFSFKR